MICDWGIWFILVRTSIYGSYWYTVICEILKNGKYYFLWIVIWIFLKLTEICDQNPHPSPFLKFSSIEKVF
jgi:hypothetical protein